MQENKINKDKILTSIINVCYSYFDDDINDITDEQIIACYTFINAQIEELYKFKENMKIPDYLSAFLEIDNNMDLITLSDTILSGNKKITYLELSKDVNYLLCILQFCCGTMKKIIEERKIIN